MMSDPSNITVSQARKIVLDIAHKRGWIEPELSENKVLLERVGWVRGELGYAVESIAQEIGSQKARFILELVQNAEDNIFTKSDLPPEITFDVSPSRIVIECNEDGFTAENVEAICRTGASSKLSRTGYIGQKGIGFKSVFQVASNIHIQSNSFSFSFHYDIDASNDDELSEEDVRSRRLGIVTPIPEDDILSHRFLTRMTLTDFKVSYNELIKDFKDIPDNLLMFLSKLKRIAVTIHQPDQPAILTTFRKLDQRDGKVKLIKTVKSLDGAVEEESSFKLRYWIKRKQLKELPPHRARPNISECELVLAFPIDRDSHPLISEQDVFAFLPVRDYGFRFLIQADFILEASRHDVTDHPRNQEIVARIADVFCDAILDFCNENSILRYEWMRYLPGSDIKGIWKSLRGQIIDSLSIHRILYPHTSQQARIPENLRTLPETHLDSTGSPLFMDYERDRKYLSLGYNTNDIKTLTDAFKLQSIEDSEMFPRIYLDLSRPYSKMKDSSTDDDWHSRAANLILLILRRTPRLRGNISATRLIPLINGEWVDALQSHLYFPSSDGPELPMDFVVTVDPRAAANQSRKNLFRALGVSACPSDFVIEKLWISYKRGSGAADLASSVAHLRYLYWNHSDIRDPGLLFIWLYDEDGQKVNPKHKVMYFPSEDEYSPKQLLKGVKDPRNPRRMVSRCLVPFINSAYLDAFAPSVRHGDFTWLQWLEKALNIRNVPRLKADAGALSGEFRHIIAYQPEKLVGTLKKYWNVYKNQVGAGGLTNPVIAEISEALVTKVQHRTYALQETYAPLPSLKSKVETLGVRRGFPFVATGSDSEESRISQDWRFLEEFGVRFQDNLRFYVEILQQHQSQPQKSWNDTLATQILATYEAVADNYKDTDREWLREIFYSEDLILAPASFEPDASAPTWTDLQSCVWYGPEHVIDKEVLATASKYESNRKLVRFFCQILGIRDAGWEDYLRLLSAIRNKQDPTQDDFKRVSDLYRLLSTVVDIACRAKIYEEFEAHELVLQPPPHASWFPPSKSLWTSPVPMDGKTIISNSYSSEFRAFFLEFLMISPASLDTIVQELHTISRRNPAVTRVKQLIWAINDMDPKPEDLRKLLKSNILPIRKFVQGADHSMELKSPETALAVIDNKKIAAIFENDHRVPFLDFTLEEVLQTRPFLHALGLEEKYISSLTEIQSACDSGIEERSLTAAFRSRAYDLLCCAFSYRSPRTRINTRVLYNLLKGVVIKKSTRIRNVYKIHLGTEDISVPVLDGHVHIKEEPNTLEIFVPWDRKNRELCYMRYLPEALTKVFQVSLEAREIIGNVLQSSLLVLDDLLGAAGIGAVPGIERPVRELPDEAEDESSEAGNPEVVAVEEATAASRGVRARSAPLLTTRNDVRQGASTIGADRSPRISSVSLSPTVSETASIGQQKTPRSSVIPDHEAFEDVIEQFPGLRISEEFQPAPPIANGAYRTLLGHVIRIAGRTNLPAYNSNPDIGNAQFHPDFDHEAAFGNRSLSQIQHDIKIGAAGELFVYEILRNFLPNASFNEQNWQSTIRGTVAVHPRYSNLQNWYGRETSDIVYTDADSILTNFFVQNGYLEQIWAGEKPTFYIEVKSTTLSCGDRFYMSDRQYNMFQEMALTPGETSPNVYAVFRVYNLGRENLGLKIFVDPEFHRQRNTLTFESQGWVVTQRG